MNTDVDSDSTEKYKVLLSNIGYLTDIHGSRRQYLSRFYRYFWNRQSVQHDVVHRFKKVIQRENPDLVCFLEIMHNKQIIKFLDEEYSQHVAHSKYLESSLLKKLGNKHKGNGFLSKETVPYEKHYLSHGTKRLVYHLNLPGDVHLIVGHFALSERVRREQFNELDAKFGHLPKKIICGDFNTFKGEIELADLKRNAELLSSHQEFTFPSYDPNKSLDLVLHSKDINLETNILDDIVSDHLPLTFEYSIK